MIYIWNSFESLKVENRKKKEDEVLDILKQTVEYEGFGFNALTISSVGALILLVFEVWGLIQQAKTVWRKRSADVLSIYWFSYLAFFAAASVPYGVAMRSGTIVITGFIWSIAHLPILWGVYKFRGYSKKEVATIGVFTLMVPAMVWLPWVNAMYLVFSSGTIYAFATQTWEIWHEKKTGALEIKLLAVYLVSTLFWTIYAFAVKAPALMILNPVVFILLTITAILWLRYRKQERARV